MAKDRPLRCCRCSWCLRMRSPASAFHIGFLILFGIVLHCEAQSFIDYSAYADSVPANGAVYIGTLNCGLQAPTGIRIFIDTWYSVARLQFYPRSSTEEACTGEFQLGGDWNETTRDLTLTATAQVTQTCSYSLFSLSGFLSGDFHTYSGDVIDSAACSTFTASLQNSWGFAEPCPSGYYQSMGATFECDASGQTVEEGSGAVKLLIEADQALDEVTPGNFHLPGGVDFLEIIVTANVAESVVKMTLVDSDEEEVKNNVTECGILFNEQIPLVCCEGTQSAQTCRVTGGPLPGNYYLRFNATSIQVDTAILVSYTFQNMTYSSAAPIGCSVLDKFEANLAVMHWDKLLTGQSQDRGTVDPPADFLEDSWAVPWYLWRRWWEQLIGTASDWSPYYYQSFRHIDVNNDGYASITEMIAARNNLEPFCPSGYFQDTIFVVGCLPFSGRYAMTLRPGIGQNKIILPANITDWSYRVTSQVSDINVTMTDADGNTILAEEGTALVNSSRTGVWVAGGNVILNWSGNSAAPPYTEYIQATGKTTQGVNLTTFFPGATDDGATGILEFSHQGVSPCPSVPSGCKQFFEPAAGTAWQLFTEVLREFYPTASSAWAWADSQGYVLYGWGISADKWNAMWRAVMNPDGIVSQMQTSTTSSQSSTASSRRMQSSTLMTQQQIEKSRQWKVIYDENRQTFAYCDKNTDFMLSQAEFTACYDEKLYCPTGYHMFNPILFSCDSHSSYFTHGASMGRNYKLFEIPPDVTDFSAQLRGVSNRSLQQGFMFNVSTSGTSCSLINSNTGITCPGNTTTTVSVTLLTPTQTQTVTSQSISEFRDWVDVVFSYGDSTRADCPSTVHWGCQEYDKSVAETQLLAWSNQMEVEYTTQDAAWTNDAGKYVIPGLGIPFSNWVHVGCRPALEPCSMENLGNTFERADLNMNDFVDDVTGSVEFAIAFHMSGSHVSNYVAGCFVDIQMDHISFPMSDLALLPACSCARKLKNGWNANLEQCTINTDTQCTDCPHQPKCAFIQTVIGDGLKDFNGNCVLQHTADCVRAREASLSLPVSIAIDELDNVYIADYGNNRVRMVSATTDQVTTIAGNGLVGFSGDGGLGYNAMLRHPEAVAVNNVGCKSAAREVFFTDSLNQRIRKVVLSGSDWTISTVVGTGERGENPACDTGCPALEAILNNPRSVSLSSTDDLFIADSGNKKIRRLQNGIITTFVGSGAQVSPRFKVNLAAKEVLLPGHWSESNTDVALQSLYFLKVDNRDNLWYVDGANNRLFMTPLTQKTRNTYSGIVGKYLTYYQKHFLDANQQSNATLMSRKSEGLLTWLGIEELLVTPPESKTEVSSFQVGKSYWRFALATPGSWCSGASYNARSKCSPAKAQQTQFQQIMGFCFDEANAMYAADRQNSEIVKIYQEPVIDLQEGDILTANEAPTTTNDCRCLKYWVDWQALGYGAGGPAFFRNLLTQTARYTGGPTAIYTLCRDNPEVQALISQNPVLAALPACTATNYCTATEADAVPWCFINTTDLASNHPCMPTDGSSVWNFCYQRNVPAVEFKELKNTALYAYEDRKFAVSSHNVYDLPKIQTFFDSFRSGIAWNNYNMLSAQLPDAGSDTNGEESSDQGILKWSFLKGVKEPKRLLLNAQQSTQLLHQVWNVTAMKDKGIDGVCDTKCCGLATATAQDGDEYCVINNENDFDKAMLMAQGSAVIFKKLIEGMLVYGMSAADQTKFKELYLAFNQRITFVWSSPDGFDSIEQCSEKCVLKSGCKAFMTYPQVPQCVDESETENNFCTGETYCAAPNRENCGIQTFTKSDGTLNTCDCTGCGIRPNAICTRAPGTFNCVTFERTDPYEIYTYGRENQSWTAARTTMPLLYGSVNDAYVNIHTSTLVTTFDSSSLSGVGGYISGPHNEQALLVDACMNLCANHQLCVTIIFPGCYLFARSDWGPVQSTYNEMYQTKVYVKVNADQLVTGVGGLPGVYAFEGDMPQDTSDIFEIRSSMASRSLMNRPSSCAINSKGNVLFADTWNQRIRMISNVDQHCKDRAELFFTHKIQNWIDKMNNVTTLCSGPDVFGEGHTDTWEQMQQEAVKGRASSKIYQYLCHANSLTNSELQTTNLLVLCTICDKNYTLENRPTLCPSLDLCACRQAFKDALITEVYLNCPEESAFKDPWHRLITAYATCWTSPDTNLAYFVTEPILRGALRLELEQVYSR